MFEDIQLEILYRVLTYSDSDRDKHETRHSRRPSLALHEDNGVGNEEHVEKTVQNRHVEADEKDNELAKQQLERSDQEDDKTLAQGAEVEILLSDKVVVSSLLPELLGTAGENGGGIGLGDGEGDEDPGDPGEDQLEPIEPSPAGSIGEETTGKGTDCRTDEGSGGEDGHGNTALLVLPEIGKGATDEGHGCRKGDAVNGSAHKQSFDVLGNRTGNDEDDGKCQGRGAENWLARYVLTDVCG